MKKLVSILFVSFALITLSACSGDDGEGGNGGGNGGGGSTPIVASWKLYGEMIDGEIVSDNIEACDDEIYKFSKNGKVNITIKYCDDNTSDKFDATWRVTDNDYYEIIVNNIVLMAGYVTFTEDGKYAIFYDDRESQTSQWGGEVFKKM